MVREKVYILYVLRTAFCRNIWLVVVVAVIVVVVIIITITTCCLHTFSMLCLLCSNPEPLEVHFTLITAITGSLLWRLIHISCAHTQNHRLYPCVKRDFGNSNYMLTCTEHSDQRARPLWRRVLPGGPKRWQVKPEQFSRLLYWLSNSN
jgi:hypothetical protein